MGRCIMLIAMGTPLKGMCRCAGVTHQRNPTNTKYNFKSTMCTSLDRHIDMQGTVETMPMRPWSVQSAVAYNKCTDVPLLGTTST